MCRQFNISYDNLTFVVGWGFHRKNRKIFYLRNLKVANWRQVSPPSSSGDFPVCFPPYRDCPIREKVGGKAGNTTWLQSCWAAWAFFSSKAGRATDWTTSEKTAILDCGTVVCSAKDCLIKTRSKTFCTNCQTMNWSGSKWIWRANCLSKNGSWNTDC